MIGCWLVRCKCAISWSIFWTQSIGGKGIATCAVRQALDRLFSTTLQQQVKSGYFIQNKASGRVLEKLGFVKSIQQTTTTRHLSMALHQSMILQRVRWLTKPALKKEK
ncbi:GNAT family N-acetyltransferase [Planktomarina temperata]|nr:GNAT family N-acetyltransferase [Planktomarina temperata]